MKKLALLEITCPDYFRGYHRTVLSFPVQSRMTYKDIASELSYEFDAMYENMKETHTKTEMLIVEDYINNFRDQGNELYFDATNVCEDIEDQYFYFGLIKPNYSNGVMFCE